MPTRYWNTPSLPMNVLLMSVAVLLFSWGAVGSAQAQTVYHVTETGDASNDGSSFTDGNALSLQGALSAAGGSDVIVIAAGRYVPTSDASDRDARFEITGAQDGLKIYGGWSGDESFSDIDDVEDQRSNRGQAENLTVLSGDIEGNDDTNAQGITEEADDINGANSKTVVYLDGTTGGNITTDTVLDGLVITGGQADRGGGFEDTTGGGAFCNGGSGGNCSPVISNTRFIGNTASGNGGAIYNRTTSGGTSSPQIINSTFTGNRAGDRGGAINNFGFNGTSSPQITNSTFTGNSAGVRGGAINNFKFNEGASSPTVVNSIFWDNSADDDDDDVEIFNNAGASVMLSHTLIKGGCGSITNASCDGTNLAADPDFVNVNDPSGNGLLLLTTSPALDAGDNTPFETGGIAEDIETDLLGETRIQNGTVSVGAYERGINNEAQLRLVARSGVETGTFELSNTGIGVFGAEVDLGNLPPGVSAIDDSGDGDVNNDGDTWTVDVLAGGTATVRIDYERGASADPGLLDLTATLDTDSYTVDGGGTDATDPGDAISDWALLEAPYGSGTALAFDGSADYLRMDGSAEDVDLVGASFTVEAWIQVDDLTGDNPILGHGDSSPGTNQVLHLTTRGTTLHMGFYNNDLEGSASLEEGRWHHAAFVYDAASEEQRIYLDGKLDETRSADAFAGRQSDRLQIGQWGGSRYLDGALGELRIWTEAR
ncbi:MAG: LamG domain-containing protein, partial [Longimonas sp.]|uniref:LamG-like jellyroll fold domain-containing protein n=1 Tax=Longimonas sp. TaxID=2039626 RepID=UPI003976A0B9